MPPDSLGHSGEPPLADHPACGTRRVESQASRPLDGPIALGEREGHRLFAVRALTPAELLHHLPGIDRDRAHAAARSVGGAGLDGVVLVVGHQRLIHGRALRLASHLATDHDSLARRRRRVATRADGLAEAALDAVRRDLLDLGLGLQMLEVDAGIPVEHDAGVEHAVRIRELLDPPHHRRRLLAPLAFHVRRHVQPGAVLGLQRAVVLADDQLDQLLHELVVALEVGGL